MVIKVRRIINLGWKVTRKGHKRHFWGAGINLGNGYMGMSNGRFKKSALYIHTIEYCSEFLKKQKPIDIHNDLDEPQRNYDG